MARVDVERDRRLAPEEEASIDEVLAKKKGGLELQYQAACIFIFKLALDSAMRMREMYTIERAQFDVRRKTCFLDKTKNGDKRQVPLWPAALEAYGDYVRAVEGGRSGMVTFHFAGGRLFPWWSGDPGDLKATTAMVSAQFARVFAAAGCPDLTFHDLRHEATSRLFERTDLSDMEIRKVTGHRDTRSLARYANLRGSDLARRHKRP